jgi:predicted O-linked N-acetylglucosamine transferase (SPINDLY family)
MIFIDEINKDAEFFVQQGRYSEAIEAYERIIEGYPDCNAYYWRLGLILLLQGQESEAHMVWLAAMVNGQPSEVSLWTAELTQSLSSEADTRLQDKDIETAWLIRKHIAELAPNDINNLLLLVKLSCDRNQPLKDILDELGLIESLYNADVSDVDVSLLLTVLTEILKSNPVSEESKELIQASFQFCDNPAQVGAVLLECSFHHVFSTLDYYSAIALSELYLEREPNDIEFLGNLSTWYSDLLDFDKSLALVEKRLELSTTWLDRVHSSQLKLRSLMGAGGLWLESCQAFNEHKKILASFGTAPSESAKIVDILRLITSTFFLPYFTDEASKNRLIHNEVAKIFSKNIQSLRKIDIQNPQQILESRYSKTIPNRKLRIGYISHCMRKHSVGWLAKWLMQYHSRENFEIYGYVVHIREYDDLQQWYLQQFDKVCKVGIDCEDTGIAVAKQIYQDEIDILIDLDSITFDLTSQVMAHKPAPVQATWLGWDASGIPAIDYYIADNYSIPEEAQDYYSEKIWRLPECYISVDGFDIGVPDISRRELDISDDAIVYMSAQGGYKRHRDTVRLQMEILAAVPNSYFLIKGPSDNKAIQKYFEEIAAEVGVSASQLRFLPQTLTGAVHRANLRIADIVLDTFPYNGATTTLEALWMEVPLITLVGKQFAARNSYTMLKNVGVEEGIAWTSEEYVQWGVKLGTDATLRQNVAWKLRQSKKNAPLWNAKAFAKRMEDAYQQMWDIYLASGQQ